MTVHEQSRAWARGVLPAVPVARAASPLRRAATSCRPDDVVREQPCKIHRKII